MDASNILRLVAREVDANGIDPNNLNTTTTDTLLIAMQLPYCTFDTCPHEWAIMDYAPTLAGNTIYLVCFMVLFLAQLYMGLSKRTWTYLSTVCLGIFGEGIGYIGRLMLNRNPFLMNNFLVNLVPLTIAPALLTAGIYLCFSRIVVVVGADYSRLKAKMYTYIFIACDLLSLVLQAIGGGMASTASDSAGANQGVHVMVAGLISQIISMIIFFILWGDFALQVRKAKNSGNSKITQPPLYGKLRADRIFHWFQWSLFLATALIFIRCLYRVAELWHGFDSHLANDEATFMVFEGPMIIAAVTLMTVFHPGRVFDDLWIASGKGYRYFKQGDQGSPIKVIPNDSSRNSSYAYV